ncbi:MAG: DUF488 domain-containing protein [Gaiellaceae bacterium]|jgi:uncharacterized protein (DUF488 family)
MPLQRVATIGVYGFDAERFFAAVVDAKVDLFCDIRARRGVRGRDYAFANARRLEQQLAQLGIAYKHFPELAPTSEIRALQHAADSSAGVAKRSRSELTPAFIAMYEQLLDQPQARAALEEIHETSSAPLLLCVERAPTACHRSIAADRLAGTAVTVEHLVP